MRYFYPCALEAVCLIFWMVLRKFFADKIRPKVYDLILKIILIAYYVPAGYLLVNTFF